MENYRNEYITILNQFKKGEIHLSRDRVFEYLAAIKLNMILWDGKGYHNGIDLVNLEHTKIAKVTCSDNISYLTTSMFITCGSLENIKNYILVCEKHAQVNVNGCKIIRIDYDEELNNLPIVETPIIKRKKCLSTLDELVLGKCSEVIYYPDINMFEENEDCENREKIDKIDEVEGILTIRNYESTLIVVPKEYYLEVASILPDMFRKINMSFTRYHVTFRCCVMVGTQWRYILKNIQSKLTK